MTKVLPIKSNMDKIVEHINNSNMSPKVKRTVISAVYFAEGESMLNDV